MIPQLLLLGNLRMQEPFMSYSFNDIAVQVTFVHFQNVDQEERKARFVIKLCYPVIVFLCQYK